MNVRKLPSCVLYKGRVSHTVIPRSDAESSKQPGILPRIAVRGDSRVGAPLDLPRENNVNRRTTLRLYVYFCRIKETGSQRKR